MSLWIFKVAAQELYPDKPGEEYVFDNTHSVRVTAGDEFLYLDKNKGYGFTACGVVSKVTTRAPTDVEMRRSAKISRIYIAHLADVQWFARTLIVSPNTKAGRSNRAQLGVDDLNLLGWSQSIPRLGESMFNAILALAELKDESNGTAPPPTDFTVEDSWAKTKVRRAMNRLRNAVMARDGRSCLICGLGQSEMLEVAHLSPYSTDKSNRANPANAVCLCSFCHKALDRRLVGIQPDGALFVSSKVTDPIALAHFGRITAEERKSRMKEISPVLLAKTMEWAKTMEGDLRQTSSR